MRNGHPCLRPGLASRAAAPWPDGAASPPLQLAIDGEMQASVAIEGHRLRRATFDLPVSSSSRKARLQELETPEWG